MCVALRACDEGKRRYVLTSADFSSFWPRMGNPGLVSLAGTLAVVLVLAMQGHAITFPRHDYNFGQTNGEHDRRL